MLQIGSMLDNKYKVIEQIGKGGTATVFLAMDQNLGQQWAIKEIPRSIGEEKLKKVMDEAELLKNLDHPAIPRIVDILHKSDAIYIIMDYISGQTLDKVIKEKGPISQDKVIKWSKQICQILNYLHTLPEPVIYHDLKLANLILKEREDTLKLTDFGEARRLIDGDAPGGGNTKHYRAPEQYGIRKGKTDQRTDIYTLGVVMHRLLTGRYPKKKEGEPYSILEIFPQYQISSGMDNVIAKCTENNPKDRFQSVKELENALENIKKWDLEYIKARNNKIRNFVVTVTLSICMLVGGLCFQYIGNTISNQNYEAWVETASQSGQLENYKQALSLDGQRTEAYMKLIDYYKNEGFGEEESSVISGFYSKNEAYFLDHREDEAVMDLNFQLGCLYFNCYGESGEIRARMRQSRNYFKNVKDTEVRTYKNYAIASSYYTICEFFQTYVVNANNESTAEASSDNYNELLEAIKECIKDMSSYDSNDAVSTRLTMYQKLIDTLSENAAGFANTKVEQEKVVDTIDLIVNAADNEQISQNRNKEMREAVKNSAQMAKQTLDLEYSSAQRQILNQQKTGTSTKKQYGGKIVWKM